jgi:hypothetical protein
MKSNCIVCNQVSGVRPGCNVWGLSSGVLVSVEAPACEDVWGFAPTAPTEIKGTVARQRSRNEASVKLTAIYISRSMLPFETFIFSVDQLGLMQNVNSMQLRSSAQYTKIDKTMQYIIGTRFNFSG